MKFGAKHWTKKQMQILRDQYPFTTAKQLEPIIGKSFEAIRAKAIRLGIQKYQEIYPDGMKRCPHCNKLLLAENFYDGQSWCKNCLKEKRSEWGKENRPHLRNYRFIRIERNPDRMMELNVRGAHKYRAKIKEGHDLSISEWNEILEEYQYICPMCHKPFTDNDPAVRDCIIPVSKGGLFTKNNVQPLHKKCNLIKHDKIMKFEPICKGAVS